MLITQIHPSCQHQQKSISKIKMQKTENKKRSNYRRFAKPDWATKKVQPALHESSGSISHEPSDHSRLLVSHSPWQVLTPNAKRKAKSNLVSKKLWRGLKSSFREVLAKHLNESSYRYRNGIEATEINLLILKIGENQKRSSNTQSGKKYQITMSVQTKVPKLAERLNVT